MELSKESSNKIKLASLDVEAVEVLSILRGSCRGPFFESFWTTVGVDPDAMIWRQDESTCATTNEDETIQCTLIFPNNFVQTTHVTMAHCSRMSQTELLRQFEPFLGMKALVSAKALLWSDQVAALEVQVSDETIATVDDDDEEEGQQQLAFPACRNTFPHVTVWFADGADARESNELPQLAKTGKAMRIELKEPVVLVGVLSFWME